MGVQVARRVEVALAERRVLEQLPVAVAVPVGRLDLSRSVEAEPDLFARAWVVHTHPVGRAAGDHDVVVRAVRNVAEDRLQGARPAMDEENLVALAVSVEAVALLSGLRDRDFDVAVPLKEAPRREEVAAGLDGVGVGQAVDVRVRHPLVADDRLEVANFGHPARRVEVVEDRLVSGEALEAENLFDQELAVSPELDVSLRRDLAELRVAHQNTSVATKGSPACPAHARSPRTAP